MKWSHGFGFPENTRTSHYFLDEHALCDPVISYSSDWFVGESRPGYEFCPDCLYSIARDAFVSRARAAR